MTTWSAVRIIGPSLCPDHAAGCPLKRSRLSIDRVIRTNSALSSLATRFWVTLHGVACFYWRECTLNWFIPTPFLMESCGIGLDKRISECTLLLNLSLLVVEDKCRLSSSCPWFGSHVAFGKSSQLWVGSFEVWTFSLQPGRPSVVIEKEVWSFGIFLLMGHNLLLHLSTKFWAKPTVKLIVDLVDLELRWFNPIIKGMLLM